MTKKPVPIRHVHPFEECKVCRGYGYESVPKYGLPKPISCKACGGTGSFPDGPPSKAVFDLRANGACLQCSHRARYVTVDGKTMQSCHQCLCDVHYSASPEVPCDPRRAMAPIPGVVAVCGLDQGTEQWFFTSSRGFVSCRRCRAKLPDAYVAEPGVSLYQRVDNILNMARRWESGDGILDRDFIEAEIKQAILDHIDKAKAALDEIGGR